VVYHHTNALFSVYALSGGDEDVVERCRYDAYGAATVLDADWSADGEAASDVANPYTFTGRGADAENGLIQYRHRYYAPSLGRFVSRDPLESFSQRGYLSRGNVIASELVSLSSQVYITATGGSR